MGYVIMAFTIPAGYEPGVFSQSGERVLGGDGDEKKDDGFGTCVTSTESSLKTRPALLFSLALRTRPRRRWNLTSRMLSLNPKPRCRYRYFFGIAKETSPPAAAKR